MNRLLASSFASLLMATALVAAQTAPEPGQGPAPTPPKPAPTYPAPVNPEPKTPPAPGSSPSPPSSSSTGAQEVTVTGCLTQGSGPAVFVLSDARTATQLPTEAGRSYLLARGADDVNFTESVNHEVQVTGETEASPSATAPEQKMGDKDLPKLTAKTLTSISDRCMAPESSPSPTGSFGPPQTPTPGTSTPGSMTPGTTTPSTATPGVVTPQTLPAR